VPVNAVEMLVFGGNSQRVYSFNIQEVKGADASTTTSGNSNSPTSALKTANVKCMKKSMLREVAEFSAHGDFFGRVFQNQYIYVTDTTKMNLHCCVLNDYSWDY